MSTSVTSPLSSATAVKDALEGEFLETGVIFFEGLENRFEDLLKTFCSLAVPVLHRDSDDRGITRIAARGSNSGPYKGFTRGELALHTDSAADPNPPDFILLFCESPGTFGGHFLAADGVAAAQALREQDVAAYQGILDIPVPMTGTTDRMAPIFTDRNGEIGVRFRCSDPARAEDSAHLEKFKSILHDVTVKKPCVAGSGYFLNNMRWLHGRTRYRGDRVVFRVQGQLR
jgi:hypothetical protein